MNQVFDFAVIGAGPAGSAAAVSLARTGARVALLEKSSFPRDKLCGEFISPEAVGLLDELGCGRRFRDAGPAMIENALIVTASGTRIEFALPVPARGLSRRRFDHLLAEAAVEAGAELIEKAEAARVDPAGDEITTIETRDGRRFRARSVVLAAGRHSILNPLRGSGAACFGFKAHYEGHCEGRVELYFFRGGYCGIAPVEDGLVNLCALVEKRLLAGGPEALLAAVAPLRARVQAMRRLQPFLHTGPLAMGWRNPTPGVTTAGDAALFVDPFTGDGMSVALESGCLAARTALDGCVQDSAAGQFGRRFARQVRAGRLLRAAASSPWIERALGALLFHPALRSSLMREAFRATRAAPTRGPCREPPF